ncbi:hypothetical protein CEUSTIGMA_g7072.t1 [Chlamydomonas eustigma]|uniref:Zinc finger PHD-type domain-containing protein n=1 Tax=Chlamydomonas eustigma TaxID=1157962 RepID=A0A250X987_9CHLO|nr:hypothetical protein CEUSTIGMA_g7072.t1 [Chlamydomonas eustigma]|eukprot:GAX79631.1 hypothetical protein CEUSTIGMA_g7072.t1 [Chlamydomonas eustigma]
MTKGQARKAKLRAALVPSFPLGSHYVSDTENSELCSSSCTSPDDLSFQLQCMHSAVGHNNFISSLIQGLSHTSQSYVSRLASVSNSMHSLFSSPSSSKAVNASRDQKPSGALQLVHQFLDSMQGLPVDFLESQTQAAQIYALHITSNGVFPRPCPHCESTEFFVQRQRQRILLNSVKPIGGNSPDNYIDTATSAGDLSHASKGGQPLKSVGQSPALFGSRPLVCEQCQRWFHFSCMGIRYVEDVPVRPWFHCQQCLHTFSHMEALGQRGSLPHPLGPSGPVNYTLATPADFSHFMATVAHQSLSPNQKGRSGGQEQVSELEGSRILPVLELLTQGGFSTQQISGFMDQSTEYEGGRYALLLEQDGAPVCTATFNVFSQDLPAQVNLVATAEGKRGRGHCTSMFEILCSILEDLKVERLLVQPPLGSDNKWVKKVGFTPMHPADLAELHQVMPLAYWDAPVLELDI